MRGSKELRAPWAKTVFVMICLTATRFVDGVLSVRGSFLFLVRLVNYSVAGNIVLDIEKLTKFFHWHIRPSLIK